MLRLGTATAIGALLIAASGCSDNPPAPLSLKTDEGGSIIFEYIYLDSNLQAAFGLPAGVNSVERTMAFFSDGMTPERNPTPTPGQCNNLDATKGWPLYIGSPYTDLDVGSLTISGSNEAGAPVSIAVPQKTAGKDAIGRQHMLYYQDISPGAGNYIKPDSAFDVSFGGAGSVPPTTFPGTLYMSNTYQVMDPPFENAPPMVAGTDYPVHWTPDTSDLPTGPNYAGWGRATIALTWLADTNGSPAFVCPNYQSDGQMNIDGQTITDYKAVAQARGTDPTHALLLRQSVVHILQQLPNGEPKNVRRIDMISIMCWVQLVAVQ